MEIHRVGSVQRARISAMAESRLQSWQVLFSLHSSECYILASAYVLPRPISDVLRVQI
jgi:hypothetical protein